MNVGLIGAGFVGSLFAEELAKLLYAHEERLGMLILDDDVVDDRNPCNQLYTPLDVGFPKAGVLADHIRPYRAEVEFEQARFERNSPFLDRLKALDLVVDAVDNLPSRQLLWEFGAMGEMLVLHIGVSQEGTGAVEWTTPKYDTFSLSPVALSNLSPEQQQALTQHRVKRLRPCQLSRLRGLGLNTAVAASKAVGIAIGMDPTEAALPEERGVLTTWSATNTSHRLVEVRRNAL